MPYSTNEKRKQHFLLNRDKILAYRRDYYKKKRSIILKQNLEYRKRNRKKINEKMKIYTKLNFEKIAQYKKIYYLKHKKRINENNKLLANKKRVFDIQFRLKQILRSRLYHIIKGKNKNGSHVKDLGCSIPELKLYLENQFIIGMNWDNYGLWHIDHKKPLSKFDLTNRKQFLEAVHYTNLQPLWAAENMKKGNSINQGV